MRDLRRSSEQSPKSCEIRPLLRRASPIVCCPVAFPPPAKCRIGGVKLAGGLDRVDPDPSNKMSQPIESVPCKGS